MARPRRKPRKPPEELAQERRQARLMAEAEQLAARVRDFEAVGLAPSGAVLGANDAVEILRAGSERTGRKVDHDIARRLDAFDALEASMKHLAGAYDAARRLEKDMLTRMGHGDRGRSLMRVDYEGGRDRTDTQVSAGQRVDAVLALISDREAWLLTELIMPQIQRVTWREVVYHVTGERQANAQGAVVRAACVSLAGAYERLATQAPSTRHLVSQSAQIATS